MRRFVWCVFCLLTQLTFTRALTTSGTITVDETWSDTVRVTGDILVLSGVLTILPGTVVRFDTLNDNFVNGFGTPAQIFFMAQEDGAIRAVGTPQQPILFTTNSPHPGRGSWGQVHLTALDNDPVTEFKYCIFEYNRAGIAMRNDLQLTGVSRPIIDHCTFRHFQNSGVYCSGDGSPTVTNCLFQDVGSSGFFHHEADTATLRYCYITDVACGVINAGEPSHPRHHLILDHVTICHVDYLLAANPQWWTGYGIFCCNTAYGLSITNCIIQNCTFYGLSLGGWQLAQSHNCWNNNGMNLLSGSPDSTSLEDEAPMFLDTAAHDFRLDAGSPYRGTASDGTNIGAWQEGDPWPLFGTAAIRIRPALPEPVKFSAWHIAPNPFKDFLVIERPLGLAGAGWVRGSIMVHAPDGRLLRTVRPSPNTEQVLWDGRNGSGQAVPAGIYLVTYASGGQQNTVKVVKSR